MIKLVTALVLYRQVLLPLLGPPLCRWLMAPGWPTTSEAYSRNSPYQYGPHPQYPKEGEWWTSRLGMLNGYLPRLGLVLVTVTATERPGVPVHPYLELRTVWWGA